MSQERFVILGGSGFIGKHLNHEISKKGFPVISLSSEDLDLRSHAAEKTLSQILSLDDHLIIAATITRERGDNLTTFQENLQIAVNTASVLEQTPLRHCLYLSTVDVYGQPTPLPITEQSSINPQTPYAIAKYWSEKLLAQACQKQATSYLVLRFNGIYGLGQRSSKYGPNSFLESVKAKKPITLWGDGEEKRDLVYVKDLAKAAVQLSRAHSTGTYNVATGESITFKAVANTIQKQLCPITTLVHRERTGLKFDQIFDTTKLKTVLLGFKFTPLDLALKDMYSSSI